MHLDSIDLRGEPDEKLADSRVSPKADHPIVTFTRREALGALAGFGFWLEQRSDQRS